MKLFSKVLIACLFLPLFQTLSANEQTQRSVLTFIQQELLINHSQQAVQSLRALQSSLAAYRDESDTPAIREQFKQFVLSWKRVEALYVAGDLNEDLIDHPRYIDYFHQGNESIPTLMQRVLDSDKPLPQMLFKNSLKGVNALEYLLFSADSLLGKRRLEASLLASKNILTWLEEIADFYQYDETFVNKGQASLSLIVNKMIDSHYKTMNWRVGEAGGLIAKYQDNPSFERLEYHVSALSLEAILAILDVHQQVVNHPSGLLAYSATLGVKDDLSFIAQKIKQAKNTAEGMPKPLKDQLSSSTYQQLFMALQDVHNAYYFMLIDSLGLHAQIIDADGD